MRFICCNLSFKMLYIRDTSYYTISRNFLEGFLIKIFNYSFWKPSQRLKFHEKFLIYNAWCGFFDFSREIFQNIVEVSCESRIMPWITRILLCGKGTTMCLLDSFIYCLISFLYSHFFLSWKTNRFRNMTPETWNLEMFSEKFIQILTSVKFIHSLYFTTY